MLDTTHSKCLEFLFIVNVYPKNDFVMKVCWEMMLHDATHDKCQKVSSDDLILNDATHSSV